MKNKILSLIVCSFFTISTILGVGMVAPALISAKTIQATPCEQPHSDCCCVPQPVSTSCCERTSHETKKEHFNANPCGCFQSTPVNTPHNNQNQATAGATNLQQQIFDSLAKLIVPDSHSYLLVPHKLIPIYQAYILIPSQSLILLSVCLRM